MQAEGSFLENHLVAALARVLGIIYNSCKYIEAFCCHPRKMVFKATGSNNPIFLVKSPIHLTQFYTGEHFHTEVLKNTM